MKSLFTELQEEGWEEEEIRRIPNKLAWKMAANKELRERIAKSNLRPMSKSKIKC